MRITEEFTYDAPVDTVFAMMRDPRFQEHKLAESGALAHDAAVSEDGPNTVIQTRRELPTDNLPDMAKRFIGGALSIREVYTFGPAASGQARRGTLEVSVDGAPISMQADVTLTPLSGGAQTQLSIVGDLKARIPLMGGKIEAAAAPAVAGGMESEFETGSRWLAGQRS